LQERIEGLSPSENKLRRAVFLDRDGTIAEEVGYMNHLSRFVVYPFAAAAIRRLNEANRAVIVVTNQSGVSRGYFPASLVQETHEKLERELAASGARVEGIYFCPHTGVENCDCRKPKPGLIERAVREHGLQLEGSWVVGDRYTDVELAHNAGCRSILVLTGYGRGDLEWNRSRWPKPPDFIAENLNEAVDIILKERA
jgi:D-glycero-D-manno-heptose 1,7-bisphosphate phosphatase